MKKGRLTSENLNPGRNGIRAALFIFSASFFPPLASHAGPSALIDTDAAWKNPRVEVCFGLADTEIARRSSLFRDLRRVRTVVEKSPFERLTRELMEREYSPATTGIHFAGWRTCRGITRDTPNPPAFIFADTDLKYYGVSTVGDEDVDLRKNERFGMASGTILNPRLVAENENFSVAHAARALRKAAPVSERARIDRLAEELDRKLVRDLQEITILHEVSHLAGLQHEEKRSDYATGQPDWCRDADDTDDQEKHEKTFATEYDPFAITNYCADDLAKGFALIHLFCEFPRASAGLEQAFPEFRFSKFSPFCEAMLAKDFVARLSARDRAALRRMYLGLPVPPGARTYRTNPEEVTVLRALGALYRNLPSELQLHR